jgi:hypothetical protein
MRVLVTVESVLCCQYLPSLAILLRTCPSCSFVKASEAEQHFHVSVKITPPPITFLSGFERRLQILPPADLWPHTYRRHSLAHPSCRCGPGDLHHSLALSLVIYRRRSIKRIPKLRRLHVCGPDSTWHEVKTSSLRRCCCIIIATVRLLTYHSRACVTDHCSSFSKPNFTIIDQETAKLLTKRQSCRPIRHHCHPQAHASLSNNHPHYDQKPTARAPAAAPQQKNTDRGPTQTLHRTNQIPLS